MKDKEIIKALENCGGAGECQKCPLNDLGEGISLCIPHLTQNALDLINRQKARNNSYLLKNTNQRNALAMLNKQVAEQKAELDGKDVEIMRLGHEIKRMSQPVFIMEKAEMTEEEIKRLLRKPAMVTIKPCDNTIRNQTIKEFAERLKAKFVGRNTLQNAMVHAKVDSLVKEMTEVRNNAHDNM